MNYRLGALACVVVVVVDTIDIAVVAGGGCGHELPAGGPGLCCSCCCLHY